MRIRKINGLYVLQNYYRTEIDLDTAKDCRHLISVLSSVCPDINVVFSSHEGKAGNSCIIRNLRNHMMKPITISWKYPI